MYPVPRNLFLCISLALAISAQSIAENTPGNGSEAPQENASANSPGTVDARSIDESAVEDMLKDLAAFGAMSGKFTQQQFDSKGEVLLLSSGEFRMLRPGYFAWEIHSPDRQTIIADPQFLWHHDLDLETATRRPVDDSTEFAPLKILGGDATLLRERFHVSSSTSGQYLLTPRSTGSPFQELTLVLTQGRIARMELLDTAQQRVLIEFSDVNPETNYSPEDFAFTPPAGTDVFYHDE